MAKAKPSKQDKPQLHTGEQHPEEYRHDLNPNAGAGQNWGLAGSTAEIELRTAYDIKDLHRRFHNLPDDELKQILVLPEGVRLEQGATYLDLNDPVRREFTATGDMIARPHNYYVPKSQVDYEMWNRLRGVDNPIRTGVAPESDPLQEAGEEKPR
jgi:hypothetical protein